MGRRENAMESDQGRFHRLASQAASRLTGGIAGSEYEHCLRLTDLGILECQVLNGGLEQWYTNPCGVEGKRTVSALRDIGLPTLADSLADVLAMLEERYGERESLGFNSPLLNTNVREIRQTCEPFDLLFQNFLDEGPAFYKLAADWWETTGLD